VTFTIDGTPLTPDYDEVEDILYLWIGDGPQPAVTYETRDGHLVQLNPETREFVGLTIVDYKRRWEGQSISVEVPQLESRVLQYA
jgi:hypothetical protein